MNEIEVEFHPEARDEYLDALGGYLLQSTSVGRRFQQQLIWAVEQIKSGPDRWPRYEDAIRWIRLRRFPYLIYYEPLAQNRIQVLAVGHERRRPGYWKHRREG